MVPLPPPPLPPQQQPATQASAGLRFGGADPMRTSVAQAGQLSRWWAVAFTAGWALITFCVAAVGQGSIRVGKPTMWLSDAPWLTLIVFVGPAAALYAGAVNHALSRHVGVCAAALVGATSLADRHHSPGAAVAQGALAFLALLISIGCHAGTLRAVDPASNPAP